MKKLTCIVMSILMCAFVFVGCGEKTTDMDVDINKLMSDIQGEYGENWLANSDITDDMFAQEFGLNMDLVDSYVGKMPMIGFHPDRVVIVKAKAGKGAEVETELKKVLDRKINEEGMYPANLAKVQSAQVVRNGDYVAFLLVGAPDDVNMDDEKAALQFAKDQTKIAVDKFNGAFQ